jgi:hypothetical protein
MMTRILGAAGLTLSLTLVASPTSARPTFFWYTMHACQYYPGGQVRTPADVAECRRKKLAGNVLKLCRDPMRRGPIPCEPNQATVWSAPRP